MSPSGPPFRLSYLSAFDGLRGLSIVMVMAFHAELPFAQGGFLGVDVFFVLSGFLITALLMEEWQRAGSISLVNFYARRGLRLLPALFVLLAVFLAVPWFFIDGDRAAWKRALVVLFYAANWVQALELGRLYRLAPTWSLAIEEQFYLLWPPLLMLLLIRRIGRRWVLALVLLGIVSAYVNRIVLSEVFDASQPRLYYGTDSRADSLLLGCLVGLLAAWKMLPTRGWLFFVTRYSAVPALGLLLTLAYYARWPVDSVYWSVDTLASVAASALLVALLTSPPRFVLSILEHKALVWPGRISYGLYLWHVPIFHGLLKDSYLSSLGVVGIQLHLVRFAVVFAVATLSFFLVERPLLKLKQRFRARDAQVVVLDQPLGAGVTPRGV